MVTVEMRERGAKFPLECIELASKLLPGFHPAADAGSMTAAAREKAAESGRERPGFGAAPTGSGL